MTDSPGTSGGRAAAFLDRDGTIILDANYLSDPDGVVLLEGAVEGIRAFKAADYLVVVITNQSVIARGMADEDTLRAIHERMQAMLRPHGAEADAIYYCPHHADGVVPAYSVRCECRKPAPGMILRAADELDVDLPRSVMIGDAESDVLAGKNAGCATVRIAATAQAHAIEADHTAANLADAARWFLSGPHFPEVRANPERKTTQLPPG